MGIYESIVDAFGGVLGDQWQDVVTANAFNEFTAVAPGVRKRSQNGRGNNRGSDEVISNGSYIFVPEGTAAFVFSRAGIEQVITTPGGYEYRNGVASIFDAQDRRDRGLLGSLFGGVGERVRFSGMSSEEKRVAFVNLREIRGLRFGTKGPLAYNDLFYGTDLEIYARGTFSVQVTDPTRFLTGFVPANAASYALDDPTARKQLVAEFLHSFIAAVNALSSTYRISQLPSQVEAIAERMRAASGNASTWEERFGLRLMGVAIESIEFSDDSRELVYGYAERRMNVAAYEDVSQHAANVAAQQLIAEGVRDNGLGDAGGMLFGMNFASMMNPQTAEMAGGATAAAAVRTPVAPTPDGAGEAPDGGAVVSGEDAAPVKAPALSFDEQMDMLKQLKELLDAGILTQEEFDAKKREILGL